MSKNKLISGQISIEIWDSDSGKCLKTIYNSQQIYYLEKIVKHVYVVTTLLKFMILHLEILEAI